MSKLLVFDMDDCLVTTSPAFEMAAERVLPKAYGLSHDEVLAVREKIYKKTGCTHTYFAKKNGKDEMWVEQLYINMTDEMGVCLPELIAICDVKPKLLEGLINAGWTLAVITQAPRKHAMNVLAHMGLTLFFNENLILGRDDTPGFSKRDEAPFKELLSRLDFTPSEKIMLEDSPLNLKAPKALGFKVGLVGESAPESWMDWYADNVNDLLRGIVREELGAFTVEG